jgi:pimeloyl-ACP methyl ester carboxylesterase
MSFPFLGEDKELNEMTRREADSGAFITLSAGVTHYELDGPEDGEVVVLIHGFSVPYFIFDPTFEFLKEAGFRVLRYDLFGRGWSDRPRAKYGIGLFVRQLADMFEALQLRRVHLIGLSLGGPISTAFIDRCPEYVSRHVLIDPAGARAIKLPRILVVTKLPLIGELALGLFGNVGMAKSLVSDFFDPQMVEEFKSKYIVQMQFRGFKRAILSTMRSGMLDSFYETYERVGKLGKPTLLFWGRDDITVPFEHSEKIRMAIPQAEFHAIDDCGHIPHFEKPEIVNPILKRFLKANA